MKWGLSHVTHAPPIQRVVCDKEMASSEWKNEETSALITVLGEDRVQTANKPVYMKIAVENGLSEKRL